MNPHRDQMRDVFTRLLSFDIHQAARTALVDWLCGGTPAASLHKALLRAADIDEVSNLVERCLYLELWAAVSDSTTSYDPLMLPHCLDKLNNWMKKNLTPTES